MDSTTREKLLALNRQFYHTTAPHFHLSRRQPWDGFERVLDRLEQIPGALPLRLLDVGCGNGRFARSLEALSRSVDYVGLDGNTELLAYAREGTAGLSRVACRFVIGDLATPSWPTLVGEPETFDAVICLATLHHLPSYALRCRVMTDLAQLCVRPQGRVIISAWQFLDSERLSGRRIPWTEIGLHPEAVETGDALLPWNQGVDAIRYAHHTDHAELARLAADAGLTLQESFRADGKEGNLNLYVILQP